MRHTGLPYHLRFRQVHLDFHTSGDIPNVGAKFDKSAFQEALRRGHVDSVTVFAKCHHGFSYHPTRVGLKHPSLERNLLGEQIEACREIGVRCPIYISAGFDEYAAATHPEWIVVDKSGEKMKLGNEPKWFCMNFATGYLDYLCAQIEEVVDMWRDNDGVFLDIIAPWPDYRTATQNLRTEDDAYKQAQEVLLNYYERANQAVRSRRINNPVFHNGGHIPVGARRFNLLNSHFELESLPTGGWGYDHFPLSARYAITQPRDFLGMTGKFHGTWGEFGGFKRPAALSYECSAMLANGSKCSVGDQLHPSGEMNVDTYALIGAAYADVRVKEPWVRNVCAAARIALVSAENRQEEARGASSASVADEGAARMLLELHLPFVVLDTYASWTGYDVVVLPDGMCLTTETIEKIRNFLAQGGKILAAGSALIDPDTRTFVVDPGAELLGRSDYDPDYLVATELASSVSVRSPIVIPGGAYEVRLTTGTVLAERRVPYFNRTAKHFCSHQHAPDSPRQVGAGAIVGDGIVWFAHNLFSQYRTIGQPLFRDFFRAGLIRLFPDGLPVDTTLPSVARFNLLEQPEERRHIAHLLYAPISLRSELTIHGERKSCEIIEELLPLRNTRITLRMTKPVRAVVLQPQGKQRPFTQEGELLSFIVQEFTGHQMVVLEHA